MNSDDMLATLEAARNGIAALTGIKQQFIDAGWSERGAEEMTHAIVLRQQS